MAANFLSGITKAASHVPDLTEFPNPPPPPPGGPIPIPYPNAHFEAGPPSLPVLQGLFGHTDVDLGGNQAIGHWLV
jgi:hypothetical protein